MDPVFTDFDGETVGGREEWKGRGREREGKEEGGKETQTLGGKGREREKEGDVVSVVEVSPCWS
jgi:hypothetical protein